MRTEARGSDFGVNEMSVYTIERDGTNERRVVTYDFLGAPRRLSWSPDGRTLAIETMPAVGCIEISLVDVAGGMPRRVTSCTRPVESNCVTKLAARAYRAALGTSRRLVTPLRHSSGREDAERFLAEVRGDDPALASNVRIEERELEGGRNHLPRRSARRS